MSKIKTPLFENNLLTITQISFHPKHPIMISADGCNMLFSEFYHHKNKTSSITFECYGSCFVVVTLSCSVYCTCSSAPWVNSTRDLVQNHPPSDTQLRVRIMALVQSSSMQRQEWGCPTFKAHLVPHWRESRFSVGGVGNQPTNQLLWRRRFCCYKYGNIRLWIEEWDM